MLKKTATQSGNVSDVEFIEMILHKNGSTLECGYDRGSMWPYIESINKRGNEPIANQANRSCQDSYSVNSIFEGNNVRMLVQQESLYNTRTILNTQKQSAYRNGKAEPNVCSYGTTTGHGKAYRAKKMTTESAIDSRIKTVQKHDIATLIPHAERLPENQTHSEKTARLVSVSGKSVIKPQINFCGMYGNIATNLKHNRYILDEIVKNCTTRLK